LELVAFATGAAVMVLELLGSRVVAPYLGTSLWVWTSLIGVVLGSLAVGYSWGGRIGDRHPSGRLLGWILLGAGAYVTLSALVQASFLSYLSRLVSDLRVGAVLAAVGLLAVPSVFLGMVAPYLVRVRIDEVKTAGRTVGRLYALSTVGSIFGTFLAGFWLVPTFGTTRLLTGLGVALLLLSFFVGAGDRKRRAAAAAAVLTLAAVGWLSRESAPGVVDIDTLYSRVRVYDSDDLYGRTTRIMSIDGRTSTVMALDDDLAALGYLRFFDLAAHFVDDLRNVLMIGGAGYSYPRSFVARHPQASMLVLEIDPRVTELARRYFRLEDQPRLQIRHGDGRVFLNHSEELFDAILIDAYSSLHSVPHHLTTLEAARHMHRSLRPGGVLMANVIGSIRGETGAFVRAEVRTLEQVFPRVLVVRVDHPRPDLPQNLMIVALESADEPTLESLDPALDAMLRQVWRRDVASDEDMLLTDDYAPVESLMVATLPGVMVGTQGAQPLLEPLADPPGR
jgi:spermidine synthase